MNDYTTQNNSNQINTTCLDDKTVVRLIKKFGIPANVKGWHYIMEAIKLCYEDDGYIEQITKRLYPTIAKKYGTTPSRVERAIRHAIEVASTSTPVAVWHEAFGNTISYNKGKPTNSLFVATMVELIRYEPDNKLFKE